MSFDVNSLKYDQAGLIPAIVQDHATGEVLMVAYMNAEAVRRTLDTRETWFWSRSRQKFWHKGETSGNVQRVFEIYYDCDRDTLLLKVEQKGAACHEGYYSCFHNLIRADGEIQVIGEKYFDPEKVYGNAGGGNAGVSPAGEKADGRRNNRAKTPSGETKSGSAILDELFDVIIKRKDYSPGDSYTAELFSRGTDKILEKIGEEASEVIIAAKNNDREELVEESADLLYHLMVLLADRGVDMGRVYAELERRRK